MTRLEADYEHRAPRSGDLGPAAATPRGLPTSHLVRGLSVGLVTFALVMVGRVSGVLDGLLGVVVVALLVLAVPVSSSVSRRMVIVAAIVIGWVPVLWWVPLPVGPVGRATLLMALGAGALSGWVAGGASWRERAHRLIPRFRLVDALPFGAGAAMALVVSRWAFGITASRGLASLSTGWDHSAHFYMTTTIRRTGTVLAHQGVAPFGEEWVYRGYPQGFHTVAATIMEILSGPVPGRPSEELVDYVATLGMLSVVFVVLIVAGVAALPRMYTRPRITLVLGALAAAVFVLGPTGPALPDGFPNFVLAFTMLSLMPVLTVLQERLHKPAILAALGGVVVAVAHGWILLLPLAVPAVFVLGAPWRRSRWRGSRVEWMRTAAIGLAVLGGVAYALYLASSESLTRVLTTGGGVQAAPISETVLLTGAAIVAAPLCWMVVRRRSVRMAGTVVRTALLALIPLGGVLVAAIIGYIQLDGTAGPGGLTTGHLSYYFFKFAIGLTAVSTMVLVTAVGVAATRAVPSYGRSIPLWGAAIALGLVLTQAFGVTVPQLVDVGMGQAAPGLARQRNFILASGAPAPAIAGLLNAADQYEPAESGHVVYVTYEPGWQPIQAAQWYFALTGTWTTEGNVGATILGSNADTVSGALAVLEGDPGSVVVVPPDDFDRVVARAARRGWEDRVRTY